MCICVCKQAARRVGDDDGDDGNGGVVDGGGGGRRDGRREAEERCGLQGDGSGDSNVPVWLDEGDSRRAIRRKKGVQGSREEREAVSERAKRKG